MNRDPHILWLPHYVETRKSEHRTDEEWERIWRQRVKANEQRRQTVKLFQPDEEIPAFLRKQAT